MGLYRRRNKWWFTIMRGSMRIQETTGTSNRKLAERIYAQALTEVEEGKWFERQDNTRLLKEIIERYDMERTSSKDYFQCARDRSIFKHLYAYFGEDATLDRVAEMVGSYEFWRRKQVTKRNRPPDSGTIRKEIGLLRTMFNVARKNWKWRITNPVSDIDLPRDSAERIRHLKGEERDSFESALDAAPEAWLQPICVVALDTGLREGNLCGLLRTDLDLVSRVILIEAERMKNRDFHGIPLTDRAFNVIVEMLKVKCLTGHVFHDHGKPLYKIKVQRAFSRVLRNAGIKDFRFHDQRHTFASDLRRNGVDLDTLARLLGHKDLRMTRRYSHLGIESLRPAVEKLDELHRQAGRVEANEANG